MAAKENTSMSVADIINMMDTKLAQLDSMIHIVGAVPSYCLVSANVSKGSVSARFSPLWSRIYLFAS